MGAAAVAMTGCCDNSDPYLVLIPWSSGNDETHPLFLTVGDSLALSAEVTGRPKGPFVECTLYDSQRSPERFGLILSDSTVARISFHGKEHYLVAVAPGLTRLIVSSSGVESVEMTISIPPVVASHVAGERGRGRPRVKAMARNRELPLHGSPGGFVSDLLCPHAQGSTGSLQHQSGFYRG